LYSKEQIEQMKETCREYLYYFGYCDHATDADPNTTFFNFDKEVKHDKAKLDQLFMGFKRCNADGLRKVLDAQRPKENFKFNESYQKINIGAISDISDKIKIKDPVTQ